MADTGPAPTTAARDDSAVRRGQRWLAGRSIAVAQSPVTASIVIAFVLVALIILVSGSNPLEAYAEIWKGAATKSGPRTVVNRAVPIVGMAIALSIPFRTGIVNLGGEGQMVIGGFVAAITAIHAPGPGVLVIVMSVLAGALAGVIWAALPAIGQAWLKLPILITSLLLNTPAVALCSYLVKYYFLDRTETSNTTVPLGANVRIPAPDWLSGASVSAIAVLALVAAVSLRNNRTVPGYEGYVSGLNLRFSRYGGVRVTRQSVLAMLAGGAVAGAVGAHLVLGQSGRFVDGDLDGSGFAWTGLLVTLLAAHRAWPVLAAGVFFSALQVGGLAMQRTAGVSWQLAQVLQAVVILALVARIVFVRARVPAAEGPDS